MGFDMVRDAVKQPHTDPLVTVAIPSDASVESVSFVPSSGVAAIDDAIRRVVNIQPPYYSTVPSALALELGVKRPGAPRRGLGTRGLRSIPPGFLR